MGKWLAIVVTVEQFRNLWIQGPVCAKIAVWIIHFWNCTDLKIKLVLNNASICEEKNQHLVKLSSFVHFAQASDSNGYANGCDCCVSNGSQKDVSISKYLVTTLKYYKYAHVDFILNMMFSFLQHKSPYTAIYVHIAMLVRKRKFVILLSRFCYFKNYNIICKFVTQPNDCAD